MKTKTVNTQQKAVKKGRILTFRGKLFDSIGNTITSKTDITFRIYSKSTDEKALYTGFCKGVKGITPDTDGMASVVIGRDCDMKPIPQEVFSENPGLYLGIAIGSDKELKPRQQIANVSYALDSEKLQGLEIGEKELSIPYINEMGVINIEALDSSINALSPDGTFSIVSGNSLSLESGDQGDITLTSGISGSLKLRTGGFSDTVSSLFIGSDGNIGISSETPSDFKLQIAGDTGPDTDDMFNLGSVSKQWAAVYSSKFLQNGVPLCDEQGNNCPTNLSSWIVSSPYLYTGDRNSRVGIGTSDTSAIISKLFVTKDIGDNATGKALAVFNQTENQDIFTASASGSTRFVIKNNGNTGVGTINPSARLDVSGGQTKIEVSTQYTQRLCHNGIDGASTQNVLLGDCSSGGADIAEFYGSTDTTIEAGDIVIARQGEMIGKDSKAYADKSKLEYDSRIIGIVSTNPYESFGKNFDDGEYIFPVALAGRVPVKISKNSQNITAGDFLTSSGESGKAMKAVKPGLVIGKALEDWSPEQDKSHVLVFVNLSWNDPNITISTSGELISQNNSSSYVYDGIDEKNLNQISLLNNLLEKASEEEKKLLSLLWQSSLHSAENNDNIFDIAYSKTLNSIQNSVLKIQNLFVSGRIISPIIETTDIIASGSSRLDEIHTNQIETDGKSIEIDLGSPDSNEELSPAGPLAQLIVLGADGRRAASIDAEGNASFSGTLTAQNASISGQLNADSIVSNNASISGTLVADDIQSSTIRELERRINTLADSTSAAVFASEPENDLPDSKSEELNSKIQEIQTLFADLKNSTISDPKYYHIPETIQNPLPLLADTAKDLKLDNLTVTGNVNVYRLNAADSISVGDLIIENNSILALADNLNISALSTVTLFDGAVTISRDGTMTTKGAVIAQGGIKTDTIEAVNTNVTVKLGNTQDNKFIIANAAGSETASIDASGSAQFEGISLSKYMDATVSGSLISSSDNFEKNGVFAPAYNADTKAAGIGVIPLNSSEVVMYTEKIKEGSLVYLTPTDRLSEGQLSILEKESCDDADENCRPYFRVGISIAEHPDIPFNWLIIN